MFFDVVRAVPTPGVAPAALLEAIAREIQARKGRISAKDATSLEFESSFWRGRDFLRSTLGGISCGRVWVEARNGIETAHFGLSLAAARYLLAAYTLLGFLGALNQGFDKQTVLCLLFGVIFAWGFIYGLTRFVALACFLRLLRSTAEELRIRDSGILVHRS
jgi:hypothetical protein